MNTDKAKTVGITMSTEMAEEVERRAKSMRLTTSTYCRLIITKWMDSGKEMKLEENQAAKPAQKDGQSSARGRGIQRKRRL